ncbi:MAG: Arc family DNA-binding protein [Betaproteobacteria bacterium]
MPNIHLRELPPATVEILKFSAEENGRSLNAELVNLLNEEADRLRRTLDFRANVRPHKLREAVDLEALIRADREDRAARAI